MFNHLNIKLPDAKTKTVDGKRFYFTDKGIFPSITTVLGSSEKKKQALREWRQRVGNEEANRISRAASSRGTALHKICEDYINNENVNHHKDKILPWMMFNQLKPVLDQKLGDIYLQEQALWSMKYRIAGRVDCIADWNGVLSVIDFKTSTSEREDEWNEDYYIQGSAYSEMYEEMTGTPINQVVILVVTEDGTVQEFVKDKNDYLQPLVTMIDDFITQWEKDEENTTASS